MWSVIHLQTLLSATLANNNLNLQIKTVKMLFLDQLLENRLAYLNFDVIF